MHDITQHMFAGPVGGAFVNTLTAQKIDQRSAVGEQGLLRGRQTGETKRHRRPIVFHRGDITAGIEILQIHHLGGAVAPIGGACHIAVTANRIRHQIAAPELALVLGTKKSFRARLEVETGDLVLRHITHRRVAGRERGNGKAQPDRHRHCDQQGQSPDPDRFYR